MNTEKKSVLLITLIIGVTLTTCAMSPNETQSSSLIGQIVCQLCEEESSDAKKIQSLLPCRHTFHEFCIKKWISEAASPTCPNCRATPTNINIAALRANYMLENQKNAEAHWSLAFQMLQLKSKFAQLEAQALSKSSDEEIRIYIKQLRHLLEQRQELRQDSFVPNTQSIIPPNASQEHLDALGCMQRLVAQMRQLPPINFFLVHPTPQAYMNEALSRNPIETDPALVERMNRIAAAMDTENQ